MERKKRKGINVTEGKRNIITALINEYDIKNAEDIQDALKDLLGGTIQEMLEAEMTQHLGNHMNVLKLQMLVMEEK